MKYTTAYLMTYAAPYALTGAGLADGKIFTLRVAYLKMVIVLLSQPLAEMLNRHAAGGAILMSPNARVAQLFPPRDSASFTILLSAPVASARLLRFTRRAAWACR